MGEIRSNSDNIGNKGPGFAFYNIDIPVYMYFGHIPVPWQISVFFRHLKNGLPIQTSYFHLKTHLPVFYNTPLPPLKLHSSQLAVGSSLGYDLIKNEWGMFVIVCGWNCVIAYLVDTPRIIY